MNPSTRKSWSRPKTAAARPSAAVTAPTQSVMESRASGWRSISAQAFASTWWCILRCRRRTQIYVDAASERALKRLAARTGRSEASHIREALQRYLAGAVEAVDDPLEQLIGLVADEHGPDDVAEEHDHYLYGAPKERG